MPRYLELPYLHKRIDLDEKLPDIPDVWEPAPISGFWKTVAAVALIGAATYAIYTNSHRFEANAARQPSLVPTSAITVVPDEYKLDFSLPMPELTLPCIPRPKSDYFRTLELYRRRPIEPPVLSEISYIDVPLMYCNEDNQI
jgi:hypothetical protein